jgi:hypothetical protein
MSYLIHYFNHVYCNIACSPISFDRQGLLYRTFFFVIAVKFVIYDCHAVARKNLLSSKRRIFNGFNKRIEQNSLDSYCAIITVLPYALLINLRP